MTTAEIAAAMERGDYSAEMLLQHLVRRYNRLEQELQWQSDYWESVPSGVDFEADEDDESPDDTVAHMAGIAIRRINNLWEP